MSDISAAIAQAMANAPQVESVEVEDFDPFAIQRYSPSDDIDCDALVADENGAYVLYTDHFAALTRESPPNSIENLADEALAGLAKFFGLCLSEESFSGLSVQILYDQHGKPASFEAVACEMFGDEPRRRVPVPTVKL